MGQRRSSLRQRFQRQLGRWSVSGAANLLVTQKVLTANHSVWTEFEELVFQFLSQPLDILLLGLFRLLEPFGVCGGYVMKDLVVEDGFVRGTTSGIRCEGERAYGVSVE